MKRMVLIGSLALVIALFLGMSNVYAQQQSTQQPQAVGWYCPMMGHGTTAGGWYCPWMGGGNSAGHRMMGCMMGSGGQAPPATQN
jgi:hypothetical protein